MYSVNLCKHCVMSLATYNPFKVPIEELDITLVPDKDCDRAHCKKRHVVNREDLTEGDVCAYCGKDLRVEKEIHAVEGYHFCSASCAINHRIDDTIRNAKEEATQWYNNCSEIVTPIDIGIVKED